MKEIKQCRICGNENLIPVVDLGDLALTGVFPKSPNEIVETGQLELVKCHGNSKCNLLQLKHSFDAEKMYGDNYGYRSGLNQLMISHLQYIVRLVSNTVPLEKNDLIIDIGSNDGTLLKNYFGEYNLIGVDPTGEKFRKYYSENILLLSEFFSKDIIQGHCGNKKAKVITSIAMFYDLEDPLDFMQQVYDILDDGGIWVLEQSYGLDMLDNLAYDTICHEHLEYYGLYQIEWMAECIGFKIINIELNSTNGGSFLVVLAKEGGKIKGLDGLGTDFLLNSLLANEKQKGLLNLKPYIKFQQRIFKHRNKLVKLIKGLKNKSKLVAGYGASTKGNVLLQLCGFTQDDIFCIVEINEDKFGCYTPGTKIPIVSYDDMIEVIGVPDYYLVLPWHFKESIVNNERGFLENGGKLILPLPDISIVSKEGERVVYENKKAM